MKLYKYILPFAAAGLLFTACSDDEVVPGNPVISYDGLPAETDVHFGDSLVFTVKASDVDVPLSTLKARLYFGEEMVSETVIRTKESGVDYTGKIYVPYTAGVPDGTATLKLVLQNINFTITEQEYDVPISHAPYPYLTLNASDGTSYRLDPQGSGIYSYTGKLPSKVEGTIFAPAVGEYGNDITFGWDGKLGAIGNDTKIPFSNGKAGKYTISFDTYSFECSPLVILKVNGQELEMIDADQSYIDLTLSQGQNITLEGYDLNNWWIDTDWFDKNEDGSLTFKAISGTYRIISDTKYSYFRVEVYKNGSPASLDSNGDGALWVIGADFGKPSLSANETGWTTEKAVCMAPVADKVYQMTLVGGPTVNTESTNFKFYGQAMSWGNEFKCDRLTSTSSIIGVGDGVSVDEGGTGKDNGNLYLIGDATLKANTVYVFTVDMTAGVDNSILTVTEAGEQAFDEKTIYLNNEKMTTTDNDTYKLSLALTPGQTLEFTDIDLDEYYVDPDYFTYDSEEGVLTFNPLAGNYTVKLNKTLQVVVALRLDDAGSEATLQDDGHGAIWMMGWGVGNPSLDAQVGWTPGAAYCMAEVSDKVYRFTGYAGPEKGSEIGQRFRYDYISAKFFHQDGWGGEFTGTTITLAEGAEAFIKLNTDGNIELASGVKLEEGALYELTVDLSAGNSAGVINFVKK